MAERLIVAITLQYAAIYNRWRQLAQSGTLTAAKINELGRILCGASEDDISGISLTDYEYANVATFYRQKITGCAVAQHCCKGDQPFQWDIPKFEPPYISNSLIFQHQTRHK